MVLKRSFYVGASLCSLCMSSVFGVSCWFQYGCQPGLSSELAGRFALYGEEGFWNLRRIWGGASPLLRDCYTLLGAVSAPQLFNEKRDRSGSLRLHCPGECPYPAATAGASEASVATEDLRVPWLCLEAAQDHLPFSLVLVPDLTQGCGVE